MISFVDGYFGWLGNQMFQAAATCALAQRRDVAWVFPRNRPDLHRTFSLSGLDKSFEPDINPLHPKRKYQEPHFHYDPAFWDLPDGTELSGYFQSEKYFAPYAEQIREEFTFRHIEQVSTSHPDSDYLEIQFRQRAEPCVLPGAVSIHVRRGDYLSFPEHHPPLTMDYYREAMSRFPGARFLVFSDDPGWCLLNFGRENVEISTGRSAAEDMALMASCDHHVIANSSFSWWGAWLGRNPQKRVIAPAKWFGPAKAGWDTKDLYCEGWEVI